MQGWLAVWGGKVLGFVTTRLTVGSALIAGFAILAMTLLITTDVVLRYVFNAPTKWIDEISTYLMVVAVFLGLAYTLREKGHVSVEFVTERLSTRIRDWVKVFSSIALLIFAVILIFLTWNVFFLSFVNQTISNSIIGVLIWPIQLLLPLGLAIMVLVSIYQILKEVKIALRKVERSEQEGKELQW